MKLIKILPLVLCALSLTGCYDPDTATAVLDDSGYTEVHITGFSILSCPEDSVYSTGFTAYSPSGKYVKGAVCSNILATDSTVHINESKFDD